MAHAGLHQGLGTVELRQGDEEPRLAGQHGARQRRLPGQPGGQQGPQAGPGAARRGPGGWCSHLAGGAALQQREGTAGGPGEAEEAREGA